MTDKIKPEYRQVRFQCREKELPPTFFIITAHNPDGVNATPASNRAADESLATLLEDRNLPHFPVVGGSEDFSHAEPGYGIECGREEALELAHRFRQQAIFEVGDGQVTLISALEEPDPDEVVGNWRHLQAP